jgi:hypothetical protein
MPACRAGQTRDTALPSWLWFDAPGLFALNVRRAACGLTARPCRRATRKRPLSPHHDLGSILAQKAQQNPFEKSLQGQPITRQVFRRTACKGCPMLFRSVVTQGPSAVTPALDSRNTFSLDALLLWLLYRYARHTSQAGAPPRERTTRTTTGSAKAVGSIQVSTGNRQTTASASTCNRPCFLLMPSSPWSWSRYR